jgi:purine-nucleoside phosphorylase
LIWPENFGILFSLKEEGGLKEASIVSPKTIPGFQDERVIYIPCDLPSHLLASALKKQSSFEFDLGFGFFFKLQGSAVLFQALGAPLAALALEPMIVSGAKEIVVLGFCGSLSERFEIGDAVSISQAFSEDGTSKHYLPRKRLFFPSPALRTQVESDLRASGGNFKAGAIVSMDAPLRETKSWLRRNQKRGAELVDMETAAVFALAEFHTVRAASLQIVSDELSSGKWKSGFSSSHLEDQVKEYFLPLIVAQN